MSSSKKQWPIEPLQRAVEAALEHHKLPGIASLFIKRGFDKVHAENQANAYRDGLVERKITLRFMDTVCIEALGVHPIEVYGLDYFDPKYDLSRVTKPCRGCQGPKGPSDLHYCGACKEEREKPRPCKCGCGQELPKGSKRQFITQSHSPSYQRTLAKRRASRAEKNAA